MMPWRKRKAPAGAAAVQPCRREGGWAESFPRPLRPPEAEVYEGLREAVPILDAAIQKIVRLSGGFRLEHPDPRAQGLLEGFRRRVPWGRSAVGLDSFLAGYLDCLLTYGSAVGEMVLSPGGREVAALYLADLRDLELRPGATPLETELLTASPGGAKPLPGSYPPFFCSSSPLRKASRVSGVSSSQ